MNKHWIDHCDDGYFHFHCDEKNTEQSCDDDREPVTCKGCGKTFKVSQKVTIEEVPKPNGR